jgi:two-component system chemotaxis response regulator CheY
MKALVVDDSKTMCEMVKVTLSGLGFDVTACYDGTEAVDISGKNNFDLVVTDINMPNMDGIELIRYLRKEAGYTKTPILVLTTEAGDNAKAQGKLAGATGWIVKPFKPKVLEAAVTKVCGL